MGRYSTVPDKVPAAGGGMITNPERERQGVRRFCAGMRDRKGKKNKKLKKHLLYHLVGDSELTWDNAVKVVTRWELAQGRKSESSSSSSSSSSSPSSSDVEVEALKTTLNGEAGDAISALAKQICENKREIQDLKANQEKLIAAFAELKSSVDALNEIAQGFLQQCDPQSFHDQQWDNSGNPNGPSD